eukprot:CAMPEP_0113869508 /NCGR_PEP_ID=MMETSP0780_2-20120614/1573_1 /TAXON_ID=652834 /ORGANISM="Palpitomonas bilix" /LENGTH=460 /DNA_ID=CAMNT_0000854689 /DNA_START=104 /DNA_END=1483 /DNA_ORIENTATION=- /assembly_acc=CAM_ASM_000599
MDVLDLQQEASEVEGWAVAEEEGGKGAEVENENKGGGNGGSDLHGVDRVDSEGDSTFAEEMDAVLVEVRRMNELAVVQMKKGDLKYAEALLVKAFERLKDAPRRTPVVIREFAATVSNCGTLELRMGNLDRAMENFLTALSHEDDIGNAVGKASSLINISILFYAKQQYNTAFERAEKALSILLEDDEVREMARITSKQEGGEGGGEKRITKRPARRRLKSSSVADDLSVKARTLASAYHEIAVNLECLGDTSGVVVKKELMSKSEARNRAVRLYFLGWDIAEQYLGVSDPLTQQLKQEYLVAVQESWQRKDQIPKSLNWKSKARVRKQAAIIQCIAEQRVKAKEEVEKAVEIKQKKDKQQHEMTKIEEEDWELFERATLQQGGRQGQIHEIVRSIRKERPRRPMSASPVLEFLSHSDRDPSASGPLSHRAKGALRLLQSNTNTTTSARPATTTATVVGG